MEKIIISDSFKKYFKNSSWFFIDYGINFSLTLIVGILVARYLGPKYYGDLRYTITFVSLFAILSNLGLDFLVIKKIVDSKKRINEILGSAFILQIIGSILGILLIITSLIFIKEDTIIKKYILVVSLGLIFKPFLIINYYNQAIIKAKRNTCVRSISVLIISILKIVFIIMKLDLNYFIISYLILDFVLMIMYISSYRISGLSIMSWRIDKKMIVSYLEMGWPLIISAITVSAYMKVDQIMIKSMLNSYSVGIYAAAVQLTQIWYFIPIVLTSALFPAIIKLKNNEEKYNNSIRIFISFLILISIVISFIIIIFSKHIVLLIYGKQYIESYYVLIVYGFMIMINYIGAMRGKWMIIENLQKYLALFGIIGVIINIILNFILINKLGVRGAAITSLIAQLCTNYICLGLFAKTRPFFILQTKAIFKIFMFSDYKYIINGMKNVEK